MKDSFHVPQVSRGQAYAMLGGAALMMTIAMGIRQNLGLFQAPASQRARHRHLRLRARHLGAAGRVGRQPALHRHVADKYGTRWVALVGSVIFIARRGADRDGDQPALPIVIGAGVMIGVALACTSSGITANIAARVVAADTAARSLSAWSPPPARSAP